MNSGNWESHTTRYLRESVNMNCQKEATAQGEGRTKRHFSSAHLTHVSRGTHDLAILLQILPPECLHVSCKCTRNDNVRNKIHIVEITIEQWVPNGQSLFEHHEKDTLRRSGHTHGSHSQSTPQPAAAAPALKQHSTRVDKS